MAGKRDLLALQCSMNRAHLLEEYAAMDVYSGSEPDSVDFSDADGREAWNSLIDYSAASNVETDVESILDIDPSLHVRELPFPREKLLIAAFVIRDSADIAAGAVISAIEKEPSFFLDIALNKFWERIFNGICEIQNTIYYATIICGISRLIPDLAGPLAQRVMSALASFPPEDFESRVAVRMLAIIFIPRVQHFSEETMELAQHFTQQEVENVVDGNFEAKRRVLAFLNEVRARSPPYSASSSALTVLPI
jgi:hypothetical protein